MSKKLYEESDVKAIAAAIRAKNGGTDTYKLSEMAQAVTDIPSGGGDIDGLIDRTITSVKSQVTKIGAYAFAGCTSLQSIEFKKATSVGEGAFQQCISLTGLSDDTLCSATSIGYSAFRECYYISHITLPAVTSIGSLAFMNCTSLQSITLPNTTQVCTLVNTSAFGGTKLDSTMSFISASGKIYVPASLVNSYKSATNWSTYADCIEAISDGGSK